MGVAGNKWGDQDEEWNVVGVGLGAGWCVVEKDNIRYRLWGDLLKFAL